MKLSPLQKRAARKARGGTGLDMNLVSLIDIFTILIFFLLSNSSAVETLPSSKQVRLPESTAEKEPRDTVVVVVSDTEIVVQGRKVANVADVASSTDDLIAPLKAELELHANRQTIRKENAAQGKAVTIMGDKELPYRLLRKVMYTCARADFQEVSFAVRQKKET
jgi:biopolymer transport protein ExbD